MKKLLIISVIPIFFSCECEESRNNIPQDVHFQNVIEFTYKEHDYIWFHNGYNAGLTHNPECKKCFERFN